MTRAASPSGETGGEQADEGALVDAGVGDPKHVDAERGESVRAKSIQRRAIGVVVNAPIDLDDEVQPVTIEIDDEAREDVLAPHLQAEDRATAKKPPRDGLRFGLEAGTFFAT